MDKHDKVRQSVAHAYASAVNSPSPSSSCCTTAQKGVAVQYAGYNQAALQDLPAEAVENSFGCGDPLAFSGVKNGDVVVDLGCGAGIDLLIASSLVGPTGRVIGIDMTDEMLETARGAIAKAGVQNVEVRKGLIEDLPVESNSVDWIISNCVINLSPDKDAVFAEIARVLKPGGQVQVSDIVAEDLPAAMRSDLALYHCCVAGAISESEYESKLRAAGMSVVEVRARIHYDAAQIATLLRSDITTTSCCGGPPAAAAPPVAEMGEALDGKVWSAKIYARLG